MNTTRNGQKLRSLATQTALMDAAERLIAERGVHNTSIKEIVRAAGQKNVSVLQYHFTNFQGLINAIHQRRHNQTQEKRAQLLAEHESTGKTSLRDLCRLMVYPSFVLAKTDRQYRDYTAAFSHEVVLAADSAVELVRKSGGGGDSGRRLAMLVREALPHLDDRTFAARMELAVRLCSAAIGNHMRQKNPMKGPKADFFINNLIDALEGLLSARHSNAD